MTTCQACAVGIGDLKAPIGTREEGIGACKNCHSIACGYHGHRDKNAPEFRCVLAQTTENHRRLTPLRSPRSRRFI